MQHTNFRENGPCVSEMKVFTIYGRDGHLGHVTSIMCYIFISLYLNMVKMAQWFLRKSKFNFMEIGQPVQEKIFERFLPYKGMVAILFM